MRVAIVTESFLPQVNGVTNSVLRVCEQLTRDGHQALVIAPGPGPTEWARVPVVRTPSCPVPRYKDFRVALPFPSMTSTLRDFRPDVVHLASPYVLGVQAATTARQLGIPCLAVYQTDLAAYASRYRMGFAEPAVWRRLAKLHRAVNLTLAPSTATVLQLEAHGVERIVRWGRGVDLERFHPSRRDPALRRAWAPAGEVIVGYVGRLAHEKELGLLAAVQELPGIQLVLIGDGPQRRHLERQLDRAQFTGLLSGNPLATAFASLDVFVHTGSHETFCQAAQEALASGVPVVAPAAGGLLDLVRPGETGLLFEPGSPSGVAECIAALQTGPDVRQAMGEAARRSVEGRSWDVLGRELIGHYRGVIAEAAAQPWGAAA